jgi:hypothetical protein
MAPELSPPDRDALRKLEESLWRAETRFDREYMEQLLAPDFVEFGRSGQVHSRADTLSAPAGSITATLRDLAVQPIGSDVALVTYVSEVGDGENATIGNRSSIWTSDHGHWRLRFHQGTPAARV